MINRSKKTLVLLSILALLSSCQPVVVTYTSEQIISSGNIKDKYSITGKVEFPSSKIAEAKLSTKATIGQIADRATVSLIYSPDHPTNPNVTIATGLSNANGSFTINPTNFIPVINDIFVLEAIKRIGSTGNSILSVRTYVKWNGTRFKSISTNGITINYKTTAITAIDSLNTGITANDCIDKMDSNNGNTLSDIGTVTVNEINKIADVTKTLIINNQDATRYFGFANGKYYTISPTNPQKEVLISTKYCPNCDLKNENLSGIDISNGDLSNADLTNSDLSNANITGATFTGANLSNALWVDKGYCPNPSTGTCSEFKINTYTTNNQDRSKVATDANGNFVITWQSTGQDGSGYGIYAQRYNSLGVAQGSEFRVNTYTTERQSNPSIAMDNSGNFVITWQSFNQASAGSSNYDIYAQRYNSAGVAQGTEFLVNTFTTTFQQNSKVAMDSSGNFVVTWISSSHNVIGFDLDIFAKRYNSSGVAQGSEFLVNTYTTNFQQNQSVAMDSLGNFVVVWNSSNQPGGSSDDIYAQRYNSAGVVQGSEFRVNTYTTETQLFPAISMNSSGNFVVTWISQNQVSSTSSFDVYAKRYNSAGVVEGTEFLVNTYTTNNQKTPGIAMDNSGNFVITWYSYYQASSTSSVDIYGQRYNSSGIAQGSEFQVNTYTTNAQANSNVAMDSSGNFIVTWYGFGTGETSTYGIFSKRYKF